MSKRSVPDRLVILPGGEVVFIEFKRRGEKPTRAQEVEIDKLKKQGVRVFIIDDIEEGKKAIDVLVELEGY
jgi:hypothetical protein